MKKKYLLIIIATLFSINTFCQNRGDAKWNLFWMQFSKAIKTHNKVSLLKLCSREMSCSSGETLYKTVWLKIHLNATSSEITGKSISNGWVEFEKDIKRGYKNSNYAFEYTNGRWYFSGEMMD